MKSVCWSVVGIDIQDDMGRHEVGFVENVQRDPLTEDGQGCRFQAKFHVNKVGGDTITSHFDYQC